MCSDGSKNLYRIDAIDIDDDGLVVGLRLFVPAPRCCYYYCCVQDMFVFVMLYYYYYYYYSCQNCKYQQPTKSTTSTVNVNHRRRNSKIRFEEKKKNHQYLHFQTVRPAVIGTLSSYLTGQNFCGFSHDPSETR